jgi:DNA-binding IclR family transcriptional regulator
MKKTLETPSIQSLDRGLTLLEAVAKSSNAVPLRDLTGLLGIDRSSVFRLANTLRRRGFLANPRGRNDYIIGPSVWRLLRKNDWSMLLTFCRDHLKKLAIKTGETVHLAVREGRQALFIDHYDSNNQMLVVPGQTGESVPLYCTAHGKALLADCGVAELKAIFGSMMFTVHTPQTIPSIEKLAKACATIRANGFALDEAEYIEEVRCVAAPIRGHEGTIVAAIGISVPTTRFPRQRAFVCAKQVSAVAAEITAILAADSQTV